MLIHSAIGTMILGILPPGPFFFFAWTMFEASLIAFLPWYEYKAGTQGCRENKGTKDLIHNLF